MHHKIMQTKVLQDGQNFHVFKHDGITDELPQGVFEFRFTPSGIHLEKVDDIILPEKIYSNDDAFISHVKKSFEEMDKGLIGAALVGLKGLGKSFTANQLANMTGLPIIKLTQSVGGTGFLNFLKTITQDYVFFIDEFEKIFPTEHGIEDGRTSQEELLSFLDSGSERNNKVLFLITSNSEYRISEYIKNRPSRLRYFRSYDQLDDVIINEIIKDLLVNQDFLDDLLTNLPYSNLNMDALIKIIDEINTHNIQYSDFKSFFNFREANDLNGTLEIELPDGTREKIGEFKSPIYPGYRIGVSRKLNHRHQTPIQMDYDSDSISENPTGEIEIQANYADRSKPRDEQGDFPEVQVTVYLTPLVTNLHTAYTA